MMTAGRQAQRRRFNRFVAWSEPLPQRRRVTRGEVLRRALDILDKDGIDGLTMRRLAERLKIKAASLYNHVSGKQELLTLIADRICGELSKISVGTNWRTQLETIALSFRAVLLSHRDGARVLAATAPMGPNRLRVIERILNALVQAGFSATDATDAAWVHNSYVVGFVLDETLGHRSGIVSFSHARGEERSWLKALSKEQYPTLVSLANELVAVSPARRFKFGLKALLDGFEARLATKKK